METPARGRRCLKFDDACEWACLKADLPDGEADVRAAARLWMVSAHEVVGNFSQPALQPSFEWRSTARCQKCSGCFENRGTAFQFLGTLSEDGLFYTLKIAKAGVCVGEARTKAAPASGKSAKYQAQATVEQRQLVHTAADFLLSNGLRPTPTAVQVRISAMGKERIPDAVVRSILRWRRRKFGSGTLKCTETQDDLRAFLSERKDPEGEGLYFAHVNFDPLMWVCLLMPFILALQKQHESKRLDVWCLTADATFKTEVLGYRSFPLKDCTVLLFLRKFRTHLDSWSISAHYWATKVICWCQR